MTQLEPRQCGSAPRPLTAKQQALVDYVRAHPGVRQDELADALGSTLRGVGVILSAILWRDDVALWSERGSGGAEATTWRTTA